MKRPEDALQRAVCELLAYYENMGDLTYFAIPNGGKRSKTEAAIMKGLGVRAGVPDITVVFPDGHVCFLELKSPKGAPTEKQVEWLARLNNFHCRSYVVRNVDEVVRYLGLQRRAA